MDTKDAVDLASLDTSGDHGYEFQVLDPNGEKLDFFVEVVGADSDLYQSTFRAWQRRAANKMKRNRNANPIADPEEVEANALELLGTVTRKWRGDVKVDGQPLPPCSPDSVAKLCKRLKWLREQIDAAVHERSNFLGRPAKS